MKNKFALKREKFFVIFIALLFTFGNNALLAKEKSVILATTTSTQDSGLLDILIPVFEKKTGYFVKTIAVGTGQAIALGERGEADVLFVHAKEAEERFMKAGYGFLRRPVMHNDFVIVGPKGDPAGVRFAKSATEAFIRIAKSGSLFLSRGDNSGTDLKEKSIWQMAGIRPERSKWYQETGLGMGQTLNIAGEKGGYTLTDRGTYLALKRHLALEILFEGDKGLQNSYHVIVVNPKRWKRINFEGAMAFADFLVSKEGQEIIRTFGVQRYGAPLFFPDGGR